MALLEFFKSNRELVLSQSIQQVISNAGDGNLRDGATASLEFREFLRQIPVEPLFTFARQCLDTPFNKSGAVLQDVVNELGRLDFEVEGGLYQGRRNAIGFDGLWRFGNEPELVVEVKTTDAYNFALETMHEYREELQNLGKVSKDASILIVVGRDDTGSLEAQVRGSRYAWDVRLISADRLIKLVQVRTKSDDPSTVMQIRQLLHPFEYTKVDRIIDILFTTATDVEAQQTEDFLAQPAIELPVSPTQSQERTDSSLIDAMKARAIASFGRLQGIELVRQSRSYFVSIDKQCRVCCTVSKRYDGEYQPYWYAYHPKWDAFLREGEGFLILCCMDRDEAYAIPQTWFAENTARLNRTDREGGSYWHIPLTVLENGELAINVSRFGERYSLAPHRFKLL